MPDDRPDRPGTRSCRIVAEGDIVMVHSRHNLLRRAEAWCRGWNIFRVAATVRLVEHPVEVMQPEVAETVSGNPMFTPA